jgi:hypothetical protein
MTRENIAGGSRLLDLRTPSLGLFWFTPDVLGGWAIRSLARPVEAVPLIGGFRTLNDGHAEVWRRFRGHLSLDYGDYPRGRVNWREEDQRYLLLLDPVLLRQGGRAAVLSHFWLPESGTLVLTDAHYRSRLLPPGSTDQSST